MKYKIFFIFLLTSCINNTYQGKNSFTYSAKGFAEIENTTFTNFEENFLVSHNKLKLGTKIRLTNPINKKSFETVIKKKAKHDTFYKVIISKNIAEDLKLDLNFPYLEVNEIKTNKSFVAEKAVTENIEKKIANNAPVTKININNLTKPPKSKKKEKKNYSILVGEFYSLKSAEFLKKKLLTILANSNYQLIYISKINDKSYELLMGPYNTINKLKNDYIILNDSYFEDLDIKIND